MNLETPYGDIEPETDWGYCPSCDSVGLEWFEEGPICPECGHLWDYKGGDIGSWDENMGTAWAESSTLRNFQNRAQKQHDWIDSLEQRYTR